ncbi:hemerythrin domain-containing protein [Actinomadura kijaniata]|uniref:hemerythrin domain-containing protein n=1 Tax=Actinomadura kijaniata TaxID=46161 RepID=UPI003F1CEBA8
MEIMLRARHRAFLRDLERLAAGGAGDGAPAGWERFRVFLRVHHDAERTELWPVLRAKADPATRVLMERAERERIGLVARMDAVDAALEEDAAAVRAQVEGFARALARHHRTETALVRRAEALLSPRERCDLAWEPRRLLGLHGAADYYPWLLEGAPEELRREVLARLDPPDRLLYRLRWRARYRRGTRLQAA